MSIRFEGIETLTKPVDAIIAASRDPKILRKAIPRCRELEQLSPGSYRFRIGIKAANMEVPIVGFFEIGRRPEALDLSVQGTNMAKALRAVARIELVPDTLGTSARYAADVDAGMFLQMLLQRRIEATANYYIGIFLQRIDGLA